MSTPAPPPYKRTIWDYAKADIQSIRETINGIDWDSRLMGLESNEMSEVFTETIYSLLSSEIPNRVVKCNDKDAPWVTADVKTAIRQKHRVCKKFLQRGRKQEYWIKVKNVRKETSKIILDAKEKFYLKLGRNLSDPKNDIKTYWSTLNK